MKKTMLFIMISIASILLLSGCGTTQENTSTTKQPRGYYTPVTRPYIFETSNQKISFTDTYTPIKPMLYYIYFGSTGMNGIVIKVPTGHAGKTLQCVINGVYSAKKVIPALGSEDYMVFNTQAGTDYGWGNYMNSGKPLRYDSESYIIWFLDDVQQEFYYIDSFTN